MAWFSKPKVGVSSNEHKDFSDKGLWKRCDNCNEVIYNKEWEENWRVCPKCSFHYRMAANERIQLLIDNNTFEEHDRDLSPDDPLDFTDQRGKYTERISSSKKKAKLNESIVTGTGNLKGRKVEICVMDFSFLGGSLGGGTGEKILRATNNALKNKIPLIIVSCSGGARMQEGIISLMQMAKTTAGLQRLSKAKIPYISVLADPTTGGVTASYSMVGDVNIAEPNALIGFAGPRVIEQTIKQKLPPGFQRAEFLLEHGFIDIISERKQLKDTIATVLDYLA